MRPSTRTIGSARNLDPTTSFWEDAAPEIKMLYHSDFIDRGASPKLFQKVESDNNKTIYYFGLELKNKYNDNKSKYLLPYYLDPTNKHFDEAKSITEALLSLDGSFITALKDAFSKLNVPEINFINKRAEVYSIATSNSKDQI